MTLHDARGEALSTGQSAVLAIYEQSLDLFNSLRMDPVAALQPALEMEPDFISGHLLMAGLMLSAIDAQLLPQARDSLAAAAASRHVPATRERSLLAALRPWAEGDMGRSNALLGRHLIDHPRDLFALQLTHMADLVLGQPTLLRAPAPVWLGVALVTALVSGRALATRWSALHPRVSVRLPIAR